MALWIPDRKKLWLSGSMAVKKHVLWFYGHKKLWSSGSMVVKNQVLWFYGRKKLWSSGHPSVLLYLRFLIPGIPFLCFY